jgi:hypothetical protein
MIETSFKNPIEIKDNLIIKTFNPRLINGIKSHEDAFNSELSAYKYFKKIRWDWAPRLVEYDIQKKQLKIEKINGSSLSETIIRNLDVDIPHIMNQIVEIDRLLWLNRINCLHICSDDILVEKDTSDIYMVDYEYTQLNSRFKIVLYDQVLSSKAFKSLDNINILEFVNVLKRNKSRFYKYKLRRTYFLYLYFIHRFILRKKRQDLLM